MLGSAKSPATSQDIVGLVKAIKNSPYLRNQILHRIYYYDAHTLKEKAKKPLGGETQDFSNTPLAKRAEQIFGDLKTEPFFSMRMGETAFNGWRVNQRALDPKQSEVTITKDDISPDVSQKGVDMRIGMDIAALTLKRIVHTLVLVTGDSDFIPAMKFARREGANLFTVSLGHKVKDAFKEHSDADLDISIDDIKNNSAEGHSRE